MSILYLGYSIGICSIHGSFLSLVWCGHQFYLFFSCWYTIVPIHFVDLCVPFSGSFILLYWSVSSELFWNINALKLRFPIAHNVYLLTMFYMLWGSTNTLYLLSINDLMVTSLCYNYKFVVFFNLEIRYHNFSICALCNFSKLFWLF